MSKFYIVVFILILILNSCTPTSDIAENTTGVSLEPSIASTASPVVQYKTSYIQIRSKYVESNMVELSGEDIKNMESIWNRAPWEPDITKTMYDYIFELSDNRLLYYSSEYGLFNDKKNLYHLRITEEERLYVNALLTFN